MPAAAETLKAAGYPGVQAELLAIRGVDSVAAARSFLAPRLDQLHDPRSLDGLDEAVERLAEASRTRERVTIVGDYDVDGVTAAALLGAVLEASGAEIEIVLPRRDAEGYGLQPLHVERAAASGSRLLVAVDSGSSAFAAAETARERGVELVVVDHHLAPLGLPAGARVVNPRAANAAHPLAELTAAGLALKVGAALLARLGRSVPWDALLRVATLGTIADVAPLVGENRILVALGLATLAETRSPGLRALLTVAGVRPPVRASDVAFRLAPRLNAAGRLASADLALELLRTRDSRRAAAIAAELDALNTERQRLEARILQEAREELASRTEELPPIVVLWNRGWHRGVVGVAAARLARETNRPTLLFAVEGETAIGSGRSPEAIALHDFLRPWADRLERFGGHARAVGVTASGAALELLREEWEQAAAAWLPMLAERSIQYDLDLGIDEIDEELLARIEALAPFGAGNAEPLFRVAPVSSLARVREFGTGHLRFEVTGERLRTPREVVAWRWGARAGDLVAPCELLAAVERNGARGVRLRLDDLRPLLPHPERLESSV